MNRETMDYTKWIFKLVVLLIIFSSGSIIAQCPNANETHNLKSQADVDAFLENNPNCTYLRELELSGDIVDISGFSSLTSVSYLYIDDCPNLTNLMGFSNIDSIFDNLGFYDTEGLTNLCGLDNLKYIGRDLRLEGTISIENLDGIENLTMLGNIRIEENQNLENLNGLKNATMEIESDINVKDNPALQSCCGIKDILITISDLDIDIENNPSICSSEEEITTLICEFSSSTCITNTEEELVLDIKFSPNPVSNYLKIENFEDEKIDQLILYNSFGQIALQIIDPPSLVSLSQLSNGIYLIEMRMGDDRRMDKIIVQK